MAEERVHLDPVVELTGNFGKWQLQAILLIFLCKIPTSWFMAIVLFTAPTPQTGEFWCQSPAHLMNHSHADRLIAVHPMIEDAAFGNRLDYCNVYKEIYDANPSDYSLMASEDQGIVPCKEFVFNVNFHSVVSEFGLVCGRKFLNSLAHCFHIFGLLIGGVIAFFFLRVCSPRRVMLIGMFLQIVFGSLCGLVGVYELHVLFRCLTAITCALMYTSGQMIVADITHGRAKRIVSVVFEVFWSIGLILLPGVSIFISSWTKLYLVVSLPTLLLIFLHRLIPDSPRWMLNMGRRDKAQNILTKAARHNKQKVPKDLDDQLESFMLMNAQSKLSTGTGTEIDWWTLWSVDQRMGILCVHFAWGLYVLLFNSMVLNVLAYGQAHLHMNTVVIALSEILGLSVGLYLTLFTKRKWLWVGLFSISTGLLANIAWIIPTNLNATHIVALTMIPCILIKISTSAAMAVLTACTADLVPPAQTRILSFSVSVWARAWFLWAPFIGMSSYFGVLVPLTVFALISVLGGILVIVVDRSERQRRVSIDAHNLRVESAEKKTLLMLHGSVCSDLQLMNLRNEGTRRRGSSLSIQPTDTIKK